MKFIGNIILVFLGFIVLFRLGIGIVDDYYSCSFNSPWIPQREEVFRSGDFIQELPQTITPGLYTDSPFLFNGELELSQETDNTLEITMPAEPTSEYVSFFVDSEFVLTFPYKEGCQITEVYEDVFKCADIENMKLGKHFTKENPWNSQCEEGYKLKFEFQKFYTDPNIGYPPEKPERIETFEIWCEEINVPNNK